MIFRRVASTSGIFDSHRPLHFQATLVHAGPQGWGQDIDPMGKSWKIDAEGAAVSWPCASPHRPEIHTYSHTQQFSKIICVIYPIAAELK